MPDDAEWCCAAGVCCNETKRRAELAELLTQAVPTLTPVQVGKVADWIHDHFDILPRSLGFGKAIDNLATMAREHPYE